ncbi:MAG: hypothetical protein QW756_07190 [Nitrososphaerota archaeon]
MSEQTIRVTGVFDIRFREVLTPEALDFVQYLVENHGPKLRILLAKRVDDAAALRKGVRPGFPAETREVRESGWKVREIPRDLRVRHVEITGPVDRKMMINALNSGADIFMADLIHSRLFGRTPCRDR